MRSSLRQQLRLASALVLSAQLILAQSARKTRPITPGPENAAVKYLRADASLRQSYPLEPDAWVKLEKLLETPIDNTDERLISAATDALSEFERGAALRHCNWEISTQDGPAPNTSHRGAVRELSAIAGLRARMRFRDGDPKGATHDVLAALTAARHLSLDGSIASVLFGFRIERQVSEILKQSLTLLSPEQLAQLEVALINLPEGSSLGNALQSEKISRNDLSDIVRGAKDRDDLIQQLLDGVQLLQGNKQSAAEIVDGCGGSRPGVLACIQQQNAFYRRWVSRFNLSPEEFEKEYNPELEREAQNNPVIALLTPSISHLRWAQAYNQTRRSLLIAAVSVARNGPEGRHRYPDPYDGRVFSYAQLDEGFTLSSQLLENGIPLSISILRTGKK